MQIGTHPGPRALLRTSPSKAKLTPLHAQNTPTTWHNFAARSFVGRNSARSTFSTGRFPPMPKPIRVRQTISIQADDDNAEANPIRTVQAKDKMQAMRRPCLSAATDHTIAPTIIPFVPITDRKAGRGGRARRIVGETRLHDYFVTADGGYIFFKQVFEYIWWVNGLQRELVEIKHPALYCAWSRQRRPLLLADASPEVPVTSPFRQQGNRHTLGSHHVFKVVSCRTRRLLCTGRVCILHMLQLLFFCSWCR